MIDKQTCLKILKFYEARKLDVLQILSNPFKHQFDQKDKFVLELAVEQAKIEDQIYVKFKKEFRVFMKACQHYGLIKERKGVEMNKNALVIGNQFDLGIF